MGARRTSGPLRRIWPRRSDALLGVFSLLAVVACLLIVSPDVARRASGWVRGGRYVALADGLLNPFRNRSFLLRSSVPVYDLEIGPGDYPRLQRVIEEARERGWMTDDLHDWVDARFIHDGTVYDVEVRIRGDLPVHWEGPKQSWRVRFGPGGAGPTAGVTDTVGAPGIADGTGPDARSAPVAFQGRRQINLIVPNDRDYAVAPFANELMREAGLTVPRDRFVIVRINGRMQGLYYEVEQFDAPLLAAGQRPEGSIFAQNDRALHFEQYARDGAVGAADARYDLGAMDQLVAEDDSLAARAMQVLIDHALDPTPDNFRRARAVLDWDRYQRLRALTTLLNTNHARFGSDNLRLYYDESRGLLEPIPWDVHLVRMPDEPGTIDYWNIHGPDALQQATLHDHQLRYERNLMLWEWVADEGAALMARYDAIHERIRPVAWADVLSTPIQGHKMDVHRANMAHNIGRSHKVLAHTGAHVTLRREAADRARLEIVATSFSGVRVLEVSVGGAPFVGGGYRLYEDLAGDGGLDDDDPLVAEAAAENGVVRLGFRADVFPEVSYRGETIDGRYWEFLDTLAGRRHYILVGSMAAPDTPPGASPLPVVGAVLENAVTGRTLRGSSGEGREDGGGTTDRPSGEGPSGEPPGGGGFPALQAPAVTVYDASAPFDLEAPERSLDAFLSAHSAFAASRERPGAAELGGTVTISGTVIVPRSVPLVVQPGAAIRMAPGASVVAYGGLTAIGEPGRRIRITGNEAGSPWGAFAAVRPAEPVVMRHIDVLGSSEAVVNGIRFTGGLAVHEGDLEITDCRIGEIGGEDGVNVRHGRLTMRDCVVADGQSDGLDIDFGTGEVRGSLFENLGGDGVDMSGSRITLVGNEFRAIGDKGISVGEQSEAVVLDSLFLHCAIAISSKDLSTARVAHATFVNNELAIEAKRKKEMFGPGTVEVSHAVIAGNVELLAADALSRELVTFAHTLLDRPVDRFADCAKCRVGEIRFRSPETGDYRLEGDVLGDEPWPAPPPWADYGDAQAAPPAPGAFTTGQR